MSKLPKEYLPEKIKNLYKKTIEQYESLKFQQVTQFQEEGIIISDPNEFHKGWTCAQFTGTLRMAIFPFFNLTNEEQEQIEMEYIKKLIADLTSK